MKRARSLTAVITAFVLLASVHASAGEGIEPASPLERLTLALTSLLTYQGHFDQRLNADDGELIQQSAGQFWLNKQGQYRWHTQSPFEQLLLGNKEQVILYDPDLEQMNRRKLTPQERQTPLFLLSGGGQDLNGSYDVTLVGGDFVLTPKDTSVGQGFVRLTLRMRDEGGHKQVREIEVLDALGQTTLIQLSDTVFNGTITPDHFEFEPPAGTDIVDEG